MIAPDWRVPAFQPEHPVTDPDLDAPPGAVMVYGGIQLERHEDAWVPTEPLACPARVVMRGESYYCQGHTGDGKPSHRCMVASGEVLRWWTWGNGRTVVRLFRAEWSGWDG